MHARNLIANAALGVVSKLLRKIRDHLGSREAAQCPVIFIGKSALHFTEPAFEHVEVALVERNIAHERCGSSRAAADARESEAGRTRRSRLRCRLALGCTSEIMGRSAAVQRCIASQCRLLARAEECHCQPDEAAKHKQLEKKAKST